MCDVTRRRRPCPTCVVRTMGPNFSWCCWTTLDNTCSMQYTIRTYDVGITAQNQHIQQHNQILLQSVLPAKLTVHHGTAQDSRHSTACCWACAQLDHIAKRAASTALCTMVGAAFSKHLYTEVAACAAASCCTCSKRTRMVRTHCRRH